jgi:hypothetical protein
MTLAETTHHIRGAVVAFISRSVIVKDGEPKPDFPTILGTGFFVDSRGVVATNRHVAEALMAVPGHPESGKSGAAAWIIPPTVKDKDGAVKATFHFVDVARVDYLQNFSSGNERWFGQEVPDLAFVELKVRDVSALTLSDDWDDYAPGTSVGALGFPMGSPALKSEGRTVLLGPTLRAGIISATQPVPGVVHGLVLDMMQQGGASGSPVFLAAAPRVVGVIWGVFPGTNFTFAVPSHIAKGALQRYVEKVDLREADYPTLDELAGSAFEEWPTSIPFKNVAE